MNKINQIINGLHSSDWASLFIRLAVGIVFIHAGWFKIQNLENVVGYFGMMGIPALLAYLVSYAEFISGILFILGIFVRYAGIVTSIIMIVAMVKVHMPNGYSLANNGYEYVLVLLLASLTVVTLGEGKYSVKNLLNRKEITQI
jgi:putative oxidoreductase